MLHFLGCHLKYQKEQHFYLTLFTATFQFIIFKQLRSSKPVHFKFKIAKFMRSIVSSASNGGD